ncbi:unnamed protein product, partial [Mesorhabditis belari]|uniref:Dystroglycan-type cadherin-like domain-containing protein n=1 Tax=Mesorhabditis belari TaxID=2138241 RepID=A0AAF3F330_9BILA
MWFLILIYLLASIVHSQIETRQSQGRKGKFFVHSLHSASFFQTTVPVKWSATLKGRPSLPQWLHLVPSQRHQAIAYLIGTPVTPLRQMTIHVIAKSLQSEEIRQQFVVINLSEDPKFNSATTQVLDVYIKDYDAESLISDRNGLIGKLEAAAKNTFIGSNVNPYIFSIKPSTDDQASKQSVFDRHKFGSVVQIGTQRGFYTNLYSMVKTLRSKPMYCSKSDQVPINKKFQGSFEVDWCRVDLHNLTQTKDQAHRELDKKYKNQSPEASAEQRSTPKPTRIWPVDEDESTEIIPPVEQYSFWDSILVLPLFGLVIIIILLILVAIFFGCREGQQWRDYKTPKQQLEEYVSVRDGQQHLRDLSMQRQLLLMGRDENGQAPQGIHSFLQPKSRASSMRASNPRLPRHYKSASRVNQDDEAAELLGSGVEMIPVGKQTVAEAAKQCGSSLHLYRNPLDSASDPDQEVEENDSLEEDRYHRQYQPHHRSHHQFR